jgi:hypothetical protein
LSSDKSLAGPRRPIEQYTLDMLNAKLLDSLIGVPSGCKGPSEDIKKFRIQPSNAHLSDIEIGPENTGYRVLL